MVRLRQPEEALLERVRKTSFNPTMVRLRLYHPDSHQSVDVMFQSHYGAIATPLPHPLRSSSHFRFNPTMVRLRRVFRLPPMVRRLFCFNPTMVRLRRSPDPQG